VAGKFDQALKANALPQRLGDVQLQYDTSVWVGRADRPARGQLANAALAVGFAFGAVTLVELVLGADHATVGLFLLPSVAGFAGAAWLEQRERRQRAFAVDFHDHILRLDFSTPLTGMPRTLRIPFDAVKAIELEDQGGDLKVLTVDFEAREALFREVLAANITGKQLADAQRVRRMLRAAVGLERPADEAEKPAEPPPIVDTCG
jgi:hypothetical protein